MAPVPDNSQIIFTRSSINGLEGHKSERKYLSFQEMLLSIRSAFDNPNKKVDIDEIWNILEKYKSDPKDWSHYTHYDNNRYERFLVDEAEDYNIMILCWGNKARSSIHDHSGSHCFMKVLDGEILESRFAWPDDSDGCKREMTLISETRRSENQVLYIDDIVGLHRVENPSNTRTGSKFSPYSPRSSGVPKWKEKEDLN